MNTSEGSPRPRAVVAGAGGVIGEAVMDALQHDGYDVVRIGRTGPSRWDDPASIRAAVEGARLVVNLAGKSVDCRYTDANRDEILRSRVETTRMLRGAIASASAPPELWINASTATIYRHETERPNAESDGRLGAGFSVDVAKAWEAELFADDLPATRRIALRMAIVLGDGPATRMLLTLARTGLGGPQIDGWAPQHARYRGIGPHPSGTRTAPHYRTHGRQRFSWVHVDDVVGAIRFLRDSPSLDGVVNVASPEPSDNRTLMRTLRQIVGAPFGLPSWRFMLEPAMWVLRTEPELILKSRWAIPERLVGAGYTFRRPELEPALRDAAERIRRRGRRRRSGRS